MERSGDAFLNQDSLSKTSELQKANSSLKPQEKNARSAEGLPTSSAQQDAIQILPSAMPAKPQTLNSRRGFPGP